MGISGLLPNLRSVTERIPISSLRGKTVAVDAYCLLHKGAYSCSRELVEGIPTDKCTNYCLRRIDALIEAGVTPYVVFDGGPLPNKKEEEEARQASRADSLQKARHLWHQGSKVASMEFYQRAVDITPEIANALAQELKARNIKFVIAPYEADAQCAYLAINGFVDAVLTEDSDLICYGCSNVLFKFDGSVADQVQFADLAHCRELSFVGWDLYMFQQMCVLAGCDFVKALPGIGVKKAHAHMRRTRSVERVIRGLRFDGIKVPATYASKVQRALWTFKYQRVYCPRRRCVVNLHEIPELGLESDGFCPEAAVLVGGEADFLGRDIPRGTAQGIAEGILNPVTWLPFSPRDRGGNSCASAGTQYPRGSIRPSGYAARPLTHGVTSLMHRVVMANHQGTSNENTNLNMNYIRENGSRQTSGLQQSQGQLELSGPCKHVRKPNGQLMLDLRAVKKGLKKALGEPYVEDTRDGVKRAGADDNSAGLSAQEPLWMPGMAAPIRQKEEGDLPDVDADNNNDEKAKQRKQGEKKRLRQSITPGRSLDLIYDDGFESPAVTASDGGLFSSGKYRKQTTVEHSTFYTSMERDAATSTDRIEALWGRSAEQRSEADEKAGKACRSDKNPFASYFATGKL